LGEIEVDKRHPVAAVDSRFGISQRLQEMMCMSGQSCVFEEGEQLFLQMMGIEVSAHQIQRVSEYYGQKLEEEEIQKTKTGIAINGTNAQSDETVYVMVDGSMVFTREEGWKEMKLGRIFEAKNKIERSVSRTNITASQYVIHLGNHEVFTQKMESYTDYCRNKIFIADGARWIWKWVSETYPESEQILDLYHAIEKAGSFAQYQFKEQDKRRQWLSIQKEKLLNDKVREVIREVKQMKGKNTMAEKSRQDVIRYYEENESRMQYATYLSKGYLVGSGAMESAHRNVVQQRMKLSGQRWSVKGAQCIASLRANHKSNKWKNIIDLIKTAA